ncbi:MAG TPA: ketoacyl-ACP synthase III [Bryobacteraceae bacterium]|nr:ketoacyl-ACP synthase III [Bryobacteraceae bacterium]
MAFLRGFGAWLPERVVTNEQLAQRLGCQPDWIHNVSGIRERRYAEETVTVADLAVRAGEDCLARTGADRSKIGMLMVASGSAERRFPGPAAEVARRLELTDRPAIDLPMASAGSLFGMALASRLVDTWGDVLVIAAEKMSVFVDREPLDRNVAILFGDGAGACLVSGAAGPAKIVDSILRSDGAFTDALKLDFGGPLVMNGLSVILQAARKLPKAIKELLARNGIEPNAVQVYLLHQANQNLIAKIASGMGVETASFYSNIERYGNTSSASMLIAASEWAASAGFGSAPLVFGGFGAGFHWGALLAEPVTPGAVSQ